MTGYFAGLVCQTALFARVIVDLGKRVRSLPAKSELRTLAVKFKDFPLYNMPTSLMTEVSQNLPILMMGLIFAPDVIGLYAMADRLVRKPLGVMTKPLQDVFMVKGAEIANNNKSILRPFMKVTIGLLLLGIIPFTSLALYGQYVLEFVLGSKWVEAGAYVEVLAPWYLATWIAICVRPVVIIYRYQGSWLVIQIAALLLRALVFLASYVLGMSVMSTLVSFTIVNILITIGLLSFAVYIIINNARCGSAY